MLVVVDVAASLADELIARLAVDAHADLVRHRARGHEDGRLLAQQVGRRALAARWTVGSSSKTSSPTSALRPWPARIAAVGLVTVSLRKSRIGLACSFSFVNMLIEVCECQYLARRSGPASLCRRPPDQVVDRHACGIANSAQSSNVSDSQLAHNVTIGCCTGCRALPDISTARHNGPSQQSEIPLYCHGNGGSVGRTVICADAPRNRQHPAHRHASRQRAERRWPSCASGSARAAMSSAKRAGGGRSKSLASRCRRSRSSSGSAATCATQRLGGGARLLGTHRQGGADGRDDARAGGRIGGGPRGGRSGVSGDDPADSREHLASFRQAILHRDVRVDRADGSYLGQRYLPLARVGICVPGGAAAYPSTVLMTAVPAQAAGVKEMAVVAPPTKFGAYNPDLLATCHELGIQRSLSRRRSTGRGGAGLWRRRVAARSIRSSARATCSSRWPRSTSLAKSISTRSPGRARWWSSPTTRRGPTLRPPI